ncbi:LysM domain-containing protein, partial [Halobellus sp. Atlit-31R]
MAKGINDFLKDLFASEGGGVLDIENKFGYIGKCQFGEDALVDLGYYKGDSSSNRTASGKFKYDWSGEWTGKNGATSKQVFLASEAIQDNAARDWVALLCKRMKRYKLAQYIG